MIKDTEHHLVNHPENGVMGSLLSGPFLNYYQSYVDYYKSGLNHATRVGNGHVTTFACD